MCGGDRQPQHTHARARAHTHTHTHQDPVYVTLGATKLYTVTAYDLNCQDNVRITVRARLHNMLTKVVDYPN